MFVDSISNNSINYKSLNKQNFTANEKSDENNADTFNSRFKNEYHKQTNSTIGKILFWASSIGLLLAVGGSLIKKGK